MKVITRTILKHLITDANGLCPDMVDFHNIKVNGETRGCSGFLRYENGQLIYVNTEYSCYGPLSDKILYRRAKHEKDYCGERNNFLIPSFKFKHDYNMIREFKKLAYGADFGGLCN